jgi:phosphoenolpyruvate carboxylase
MQAYAGLVADASLRERFQSAILAEFQTTRRMLEALYGCPLEAQKPTLTRSIEMRSPALLILHRQQVRLLAAWREAQRAGNEADAKVLLPRLLLLVNAIASGLGTTG